MNESDNNIDAYEGILKNSIQSKSIRMFEKPKGFTTYTDDESDKCPSSKISEKEGG